MKKIILLFTLILPLFVFGQIEIILSVNQPPEFGFDLIRNDTTIISGDSLVLGTDLLVYGGSGNYQYFWSPGQLLNDSTLLNPEVTLTDTTIFYLTVVDVYGCSFTLDYKVNVTENIVDFSDLKLKNEELSATLFPNPNSGEFKVKLKGTPSDKIELFILDNTGRVFQKQTVFNFLGEYTETITSHLASGVYNLVIVSEDQKIQRQFIIN